MSDQKFGVRIKWLGCACFEMDFGGATVVNDPWITNNAKTELTWEDVEKCDYITLTHGHYDHTLDIPALVKKFDSCLLCGENTAVPMMRFADMNPMRVYPMYPNLELDFDAVKIKALYGRHTPLPGTVSERDEIWKNHPKNDGTPVFMELGKWGDFEYRNFLYTAPNGTKILVWGNRMNRPDQRNLLREVRPDIAILQTTVADNAGVVAAEACRDCGCKIVIPHHFDFPKDYAHHVQNLGEELAKIAPEIRYIVPEYGQWIEL